MNTGPQGSRNGSFDWRLFVKRLMFPGTNWVSRDKSYVTRMFLTGTPDKPVMTLDCGCGNAYFSYHAIRKGAKCVGITIHDWEKQNCERMRDYLGLSEEQLEVRVSSLDKLSTEPDQIKRYDQVILLDVIEHISDAHKAFRQIHELLKDDGFVYVTTPDRDWSANANAIRVSRTENGWHVRNGYSFDQLERVLDESGFEPIDRYKYGTLGSRVVIWIQNRFFGSRIDELTTLTYPLLKVISIALSPWKDPHTIFVLARKKTS